MHGYSGENTRWLSFKIDATIVWMENVNGVWVVKEAMESRCDTARYLSLPSASGSFSSSDSLYISGGIIFVSGLPVLSDFSDKSFPDEPALGLNEPLPWPSEEEVFL